MKLELKHININELFYIITLLSFSFFNSKHYIRIFLFVLDLLFFLVLLIKNGILFKRIKYSKSKSNFILYILTATIGLFVYGYFKDTYIHYILWIYETLLTFVLVDSIKEFKKVLYNFFVVLLLINFACYITQYSGFFKLSYNGAINYFVGFYYDKNNLASNIILGIPLFVEEIIINKKKLPILWILLSAFLLLKAHSTSAFFFSGILIFLSFVPKKKCIKLMPFLILVPIGLALYLINYDAIMASKFNIIFKQVVGKGLSFSGRANLWFFVLTMIPKSPIFGYGFRGFWADPLRVETVMNENGFWMNGGHAHNAFLEILMQAGVIGMVLIITLIFKTYKRLKNGFILKNITNTEIVYLIYILFANSLVLNNLCTLGLLWAFFVMIVCRIENFDKMHKKCMNSLSCR